MSLPPVVIPAGRENRDRAGTIVLARIHALPEDTEHEVHIEVVKQTRRDKQNRLMWRWHKQVHDELEENSINWIHGETKLDWLLPIKLGCDHAATVRRAEFERDVLDQVPARQHKIGAAYDLVRSKDIPVDIFASFLSEYQRQYAARGVDLRSLEDY